MRPTRPRLSTYDKDRLETLLAEARAFGQHEPSDLDELATELARARTLAPERMPPCVVAMNSRVRLRDTETDEQKVYSLVFPQQADVSAGALSVLAPLGTAILGYSEGDEFEWPMPSGRIRRFRIEEVSRQPEAP